MTRRDLLLAGVGIGVGRGFGSEQLVVRLEGGRLRVSAPRLRFLTGKPLERLHNGAAATFDAQLAALAERPASGDTLKILDRTLERFVVSYDLWEEKFSVSRLSQPPRSISHLSAAAAEAWCLENLSLPAGALPPDRPFWIRLELRAEDPRERPAVLAEPGISLTRLIELFSRPSRGQTPPWLVDDGPFTLADLKTQGRSGAG